MKAIYKNLFFCLALILGVTACDNNVDIPPTGAPDGAETLAAGKYVGEWTRVNLSTEKVEVNSGSLTFTVDFEEHNNNVLVMKAECADMPLGVNGDTSVCNVARLSSGEFVYWNMVQSNPFGMIFNGRISPEGVATMKYTKIIREGRRETEYSYSFQGTKE